MIDKIEIKNIQSHKDSVLEFSPGINCIVGSSNNGKSAILRALKWSIYNRPLGIDVLCSNWAINEKGKQIEAMSVLIKKDSDELIRFKSINENSYYINGNKLEAIKTDVPPEVNNFFRLSETNIQNQQDAPFLLSQSAGEVAKYFNRVVRLDVIDKVLTNAESSRRKTKQEVEHLEKTVKEYETKHSEFEWIPKVEKLLRKYSNVEEKIETLEDEIDELENQLRSYSESKNKIEKYNFEKSKRIILKIEKINEDSENLYYSINKIGSELSNFNEVLKKNYDFSKQKDLIKKLEKEFNYSEHIQNEVNYLGTSGANYDYYLKTISENKMEIEELKNQLPDICPLCGNPMKNGVCENENDN